MLLALEKKFDSILSFVHTSPKITLFKDSLSSKKSVAFFSGKKEKGNPSIIKTFVVSRERLLFSSLPGGLGSGGNFGKTAERKRDACEPKKERGE